MSRRGHGCDVMGVASEDPCGVGGHVRSRGCSPCPLLACLALVHHVPMRVRVTTVGMSMPCFLLLLLQLFRIVHIREKAKGEVSQTCVRICARSMSIQANISARDGPVAFRSSLIRT